MATLPTCLIAQLLTLVGEISVTVIDSFSTRTVTLVAAATTRYARVYLAPTGGFGTTILTPYDVLAAFEAALNAAAPGFWTVRLQSSGAVKITYVGGSGTGEITWTANGTGLRNLLGFTATIGPLAVGASTTATYPPGGCVVSLCADETDTAWQTRAAGDAVTRTQDGRTVQIPGSYQSVERTVRLRLHPYTWTEAVSGDYVTPALPLDTVAQASRWTAPSTTGYLDGGAYSAHQLIATAHRPSADALLGISIGELQQQIAGSVTEFDVGSLDAPTVRGDEERFPLSMPGFYKRRDVPMTLTRTTRTAR